MPPETVSLMLGLMDLAGKAIAAYPALRQAVNPTDQASLDAAYADMIGKLDATAEILRETPDDKN